MSLSFKMFLTLAVSTRELDGQKSATQPINLIKIEQKYHLQMLSILNCSKNTCNIHQKSSKLDCFFINKKLIYKYIFFLLLLNYLIPGQKKILSKIEGKKISPKKLLWVSLSSNFRIFLKHFQRKKEGDRVGRQAGRHCHNRPKNFDDETSIV